MSSKRSNPGANPEVKQQDEPAQPVTVTRDRVVVQEGLRQRLLEMIQRNETRRREDQREEQPAPATL